MKPDIRLVRGRDGRLHAMTLKRKSAPGIGQFSDVTKPMSTKRLAYINKRAARVAREAIQRRWILALGFMGIRRRVVAAGN